MICLFAICLTINLSSDGFSSDSSNFSFKTRRFDPYLTIVSAQIPMGDLPSTIERDQRDQLGQRVAFMISLRVDFFLLHLVAWFSAAFGVFSLQHLFALFSQPLSCCLQSSFISVHVGTTLVLISDPEKPKGCPRLSLIKCTRRILTVVIGRKVQDLIFESRVVSSILPSILDFRKPWLVYKWPSWT